MGTLPRGRWSNLGQEPRETNPSLAPLCWSLRLTSLTNLPGGFGTDEPIQERLQNAPKISRGDRDCRRCSTDRGLHRRSAASKWFGHFPGIRDSYHPSRRCGVTIPGVVITLRCGCCHAQQPSLRVGSFESRCTCASGHRGAAGYPTGRPDQRHGGLPLDWDVGGATLSGKG